MSYTTTINVYYVIEFYRVGYVSLILYEILNTFYGINKIKISRNLNARDI